LVRRRAGLTRARFFRQLLRKLEPKSWEKVPQIP